MFCIYKAERKGKKKRRKRQDLSLPDAAILKNESISMLLSRFFHGILRPVLLMPDTIFCGDYGYRLAKKEILDMTCAYLFG